MKCISLLSSGIDSPVAAYLISAYVEEIVFMHADARPFTDEDETHNFEMIAQHLSITFPCTTTTCIVPHGHCLDAFKKATVHPRFCCVFCKRMMVRYAATYAKHHDIDFIVMGDSLGQVASQTLANIMVVDDAADIPIIRPLIGLDKEEIIEIAKKIQTFDLSTRETSGCRAVPKKPATKATLNKLLDVEQHLSIDQLINHAINNIKCK